MQRTRMLARILLFGLLLAPYVFGQSGVGLAERDRIWLSIRDAIRMQVTAIGGGESYSWPGSGNTSSHPSDLLRTGLLGTGAFQGYIRALMVSPGPSRLEFVGKEFVDGEPLLHFRFAFDLRQRILHRKRGAQRETVSAPLLGGV